MELKPNNNKAEQSRTCLTEMGKVNFPERSGALTISLVRSRQLRQTPAQATTLFRGGQASSEASILINTSLRSSWGMWAQQLCFTESPNSAAAAAADRSWTTRCDRENLMSCIKLLIDIFPLDFVIIKWISNKTKKKMRFMPFWFLGI